jgi:hypothetical protein
MIQATTLTRCDLCSAKPASHTCSCPCHQAAREPHDCGCVTAQGVPVVFCPRGRRLDAEWAAAWERYERSQDKADLRRYQDAVRRYYAHFED